MRIAPKQRKRKMADEPVCIALSSDEEEDEEDGQNSEAKNSDGTPGKADGSNGKTDIYFYFLWKIEFYLQSY